MSERRDNTVELKDCNKHLLEIRSFSNPKLLALAIVVSLFIITPYFVLITLVYFCVPCYSYPMMLLVSTGLETTLSHLQSVVNPFVYCWRLPKYRQVWRHYIQSTGQCCTRIKRRCRGKEDCSFDTKL